MNYYQKREAKTNAAWYLARKGWFIVGYKPDRSETQYDHWDPASWDGIAIKDGFILVVDIQESMISFFDKYREQGINIQPNPHGVSWHLEKDGQIIDKGRGISTWRGSFRFPDEQVKLEKSLDEFFTRIETAMLRYSMKGQKQESSPELTEDYLKTLPPGIAVTKERDWVWVSGDTIPYKEQLKEQKFRFSYKRLAWYHTQGHLPTLIQEVV